ncbi:FecR family protein [Pedobacter cryoconitis]|uniref:FecR family protein n=1 Tax=Pedobacter cryoconitis TaxID=188932 RepID=UPI0016229024|nr:FecR family protein [Pedobacter cryoconitis]MBB5648701.1 ferric-dicitrate binding protein FerR (iron transport regulator) [Pedobacter cryoconitis]
MKEQEFNKEFLRRFTDNELSEPEYEALMQWLSSLSPQEQQSFLNEHIQSLTPAALQTPSPDFELLRDKIEQQDSSRRTVRLWLGRVAAVLIPCAIYAGVINSQNNNQPVVRIVSSTPVRMLRVTNSGINTKIILLEDSSKVTLSAGATLSYPEKFEATKRELSLIGKAFFDVKHETARSFVVSSGDVKTTVLGTSFWINFSAETKKTSVKVKTGKVGVQQLTEPAIFLLPGESALYNQISGRLSKIRPEKHALHPLKIAQPATALSFNETSIKSVISELEKQYQVKIVLGTGIDPALKLSLNTRGKSIATVMEEIKNQVPVSYEISAASIHIKPQ